MLFVPRQVALASLSPPAAAAMAEEPPRKEKKSKGKSKAPAKRSPEARRAAAVACVAAFLESGGFPRTLAAFQSEAKLDGGAWRTPAVSLEELVAKFLDPSHSAPGDSIAASTQQEKIADAVVEEKETGKKKKNKKAGAEVGEPEVEASEPSAPEKPSEKADVIAKTEDQKPDGKKKKSKKQEKIEDVEARLEKAQLAVKNKFEAAGKLKDGKKSGEEEPKSQNDGSDKNGLGDGAPLDKGKKKKKSKSTPETSDKIDAGTAPTEVEGKSNGASVNSDAVEEGKDANEKKSKKKKKKLSSESDDENKIGMDIETGEDGRVSTDNGVTKKRKLEDKEGITGTEDDVNECSTILKPNKRQKLSEPKALIPFQRVKLDDVKFADERLQDNSYWAKGGADSGYGAKAQEILGQVRGRGFRHEKTKKKRGTYRGGLIDLQTHSIKFDNSDDE
ncbi:nucleolar and coiled-body phosphoprotein 1 [Brachypodium distachyon]|uniref:Srp40 C-terminal domain-containing protein n=1 Tax=Brachypodium distachyon TaxID=15368 RepID=I1IGG1_BRADI|nr:nucleolar and coiled-body phosphoprotein 1 [Brachypodium distachyon]KQJ85795.1 hypothetical protein BRADI_4g01760v3 [Brachypodium distachyon]|eukprot:XP_003579142.1 nucleolar and coiled-body phosphoprotein 1 [Brachypodium distachyon]